MRQGLQATFQRHKILLQVPPKDAEDVGKEKCC